MTSTTGDVSLNPCNKNQRQCNTRIYRHENPLLYSRLPAMRKGGRLLELCVIIKHP